MMSTTDPVTSKEEEEEEEVMVSTSSSPSSTTTDDRHHPEHEEAGEELEGYFEYTEFSGVDDEEAKLPTARTYYSYYGHQHNSLEEIVEEPEEPEEEIQGDKSSLFSFDLLRRHHHQEIQEDEDEDDNTVYVVVSSSSTTASMDALEWTLNQPFHNVSLVHVFPPIKFIPTPLGMMAVSQVNPEHKEKYVSQETDKRRQFLNSFIATCSAAKVKVDTILIESEMEAQAILDLVPVINITKLVLGTTKPDLRKMRSNKGNGCVVDEIVKGVPQVCEVSIICQGQQVQPPTTTNTTHSPSTQTALGCGCFKLLR